MSRSAVATTAAIPAVPSPVPRSAGSTHTPWTWQTDRLTAPISALNSTRPFSIRANARPAAISSATLARYSAPSSPPSGETPTSSVYMATQAGSTVSNSAGRTRRTAGSTSTVGGPDVASNGWSARTSRGFPQLDPNRAPSADRHQVGPRVAQRIQPAVADVPPHLRAEPPAVQAGRLDPGGNKDVRHRVLRQHGPHRRQVPVVEDPQRRAAQHADHDGSRTPSSATW